MDKALPRGRQRDSFANDLSGICSPTICDGPFQVGNSVCVYVCVVTEALIFSCKRFISHYIVLYHSSSPV